jgi:Mannosyltransferase (PIG-V)
MMKNNYPLFAFVLTRALIFLVLLFASALHFDVPVQEFGDRIQEPIISLRQPGLAERLGNKALNADALWYADIARNGYEQMPFEATREHNWAFFPLFPLLLRYAGKLTGEYGLTGSLMAAVFFLVALVQLHRLVGELGYEPETADRTVFYIAAFPVSYFFSLPFTESLFLLLSVTSFRAAVKNSWWLAGVFGGLAAATRITGLCLLPVLALIYWQRYRSINARILALLLIPTGIVPYMILLHRLTGNALAFLDIQAVWGHTFGFFLQPLWEYIKNPFEINQRWDFRFLNFLAAILAFGCGIVWLLKRRWALATYTLLCAIIPLTAMRLQSLTRYIMIAFPIFIVLAEAGRSKLIDEAIRTIFLFGLGAMTLLFALHFSMAMS